MEAKNPQVKIQAARNPVLPWWRNYMFLIDKELNLVTDKTICDLGNGWRRGLRAGCSWSWRSPWILGPTNLGLAI